MPLIFFVPAGMFLCAPLLMETLFPLDPIAPPGFQYVPSFISAAEEERLLEIARGISLHTFNFQGYEAKRKVASFGYDWSFEKQALSKGKEIPAPFGELIEKVSQQFSVPVQAVSELLVTEYPPGAVINWHRDAPPFHTIIGISLLSDCLFKFRPYDTAKQSRKSAITIPVMRRSAYLFRDEARSDWEHSIAPVKTRRFSITLRTLKEGAAL